ncbi:MAG: glutamate racemase [Sphingobacteriia bacterium]|nr:glutamate racemase [Sphingobacteriia bacterium]NCC39964.1 glutamate racemase [Gammaproteobacteria bacterium]
MTPRQPIGVFDSGVGGLSVLREIRRELPHEDLLYVADSAHAPYGEKSPAAIEARAILITELLLARGAKAIVVACNTATGVAARVLRSRYQVPVIAMEPAVKPALACTRSGVVGVLATRRTLAGRSFAELVARVGQGARIIPQACPGLVERIEAGDLDGPETRALLSSYIEPLLLRGADTLVLGCTHYPHLAPQIRELAGPCVQVLDSGLAVARQVRRRLAELQLLAPPPRAGVEQAWTSGQPEHLRAVMARLWGGDLDPRPLTRPTESAGWSVAGSSLALQGV